MPRRYARVRAPPPRWCRPRRSAIAPHELSLPWYRVAGPADRSDAPTFVLVHGVGLSHRSLSRLARVLAEQGTVLAPDLPGHGHARGARRRPTIEELAGAVGDGIAARLDGRGAGTGPVVVLGHSLGAEVATDVARQRPELVQGLVLVGPVVDPAAATAAHQGVRLLRDMPRERPLTGAMVARDYLRAGPVSFGLGVRSMLRYGTAEGLAGLEVPLLVVRGAHDPVAPARWAEQLRDLVPDGTVVQVPGAVHNLVHSHSADVGRAVLAFTRERVGRRRG
ncbi:alpha/beta fold hydrolase [Frigoribacterium salinisoli]